MTGPARRLSDLEVVRSYREAMTTAANAARQTALLSHMMESRGLAALKGDETPEVEGIILEAGRRSLEAQEGSAIFA
jgi:hypothetical protein